jgi:hypothetical protein
VKFSQIRDANSPVTPVIAVPQVGANPPLPHPRLRVVAVVFYDTSLPHVQEIRMLSGRNNRARVVSPPDSTISGWGVGCFDDIDIRAPAKIPSARRSDTPA